MVPINEKQPDKEVRPVVGASGYGGLGCCNHAWKNTTQLELFKRDKCTGGDEPRL